MNKKEEFESIKLAWRIWEADYARAITESINYVRIARGLKIKDLVELLLKTGWPATESTLNGILSVNKRKSYSVGDIYAFAKALEVPPSLFLLALPSAVDSEGNSIFSTPLFENNTSVDQIAQWLLHESEPGKPVDGEMLLGNLPHQLAQYRYSFEQLMHSNRVLLALEQVSDPTGENAPLPLELVTRRAHQHLDTVFSLLRGWQRNRPDSLNITPLPEPLQRLLDKDYDAFFVKLPIAEISTAEEIAYARRLIGNLDNSTGLGLI